MMNDVELFSGYFGLC